MTEPAPNPTHTRLRQAAQTLGLAPEAIADTYFAIHSQHRSAWTHELDLRPWTETW